MSNIPPRRRAQNPLITAPGYARLQAILEHPHAPIWNASLGDQVEASDIDAAEAFREAVFERPRHGVQAGPPQEILAWVERMRAVTPLFAAHIPRGLDLERDWTAIATMGRADLATRLEQVVPLDASHERMIVYDTSGTTGAPIALPSHPSTNTRNHVLMEYVLAAYGVRPEFSPEMVACINACAQSYTYVFANVFSVWNQAGFAKVNLVEEGWAGGIDSARRFFTDMAPAFITADPVTLGEMLRFEIPARPGLITSTALALNGALRQRAEQAYGCPVVDWYSITEVGPIAFAAPDGRGMLVLPPDLYVELLDPHGFPVPAGEPGEVTVTGGRNPYLPLLRYRTGDFARVEDGRLVELSGRALVYFRAGDGSIVNPIDVARVLRPYPIVQHAFVQRADGSCRVALAPLASHPLEVDQVAGELRALLGGRPVEVLVEPGLAREQPHGKAVAYRSELCERERQALR